MRVSILAGSIMQVGREQRSDILCGWPVALIDWLAHASEGRSDIAADPGAVPGGSTSLTLRSGPIH